MVLVQMRRNPRTIGIGLTACVWRMATRPPDMAVVFGDQQLVRFVMPYYTRHATTPTLRTRPRTDKPRRRCFTCAEFHMEAHCPLARCHQCHNYGHKAFVCPTMRPYMHTSPSSTVAADIHDSTDNTEPGVSPRAPPRRIGTPPMLLVPVPTRRSVDAGVDTGVDTGVDADWLLGGSGVYGDTAKENGALAVGVLVATDDTDDAGVSTFDSPT